MKRCACFRGQTTPRLFCTYAAVDYMHAAAHFRSYICFVSCRYGLGWQWMSNIIVLEDCAIGRMAGSKATNEDGREMDVWQVGVGRRQSGSKVASTVWFVFIHECHYGVTCC